MIIEKRSIPVCIILAIITCGIYILFWEYKILDGLYRANGKPSSAGTDVLLSIVTCGLYGLYMMYQAGKMESEILARYGMPHRDDSVFYLILGFISLGIVTFCILQNNINSMADTINASYYDSNNDSNNGNGRLQ
jgi:hypothetical protein